MSHTKMVSIFTISTVHIIALLLLIAFSIYISIRANKDNMYYNFMSVQLSFMIWIVAKILKTVSPSFELRWFFVILQYFGICLLEVTFLNFAYNYYTGKNLPNWFVKFIVILASLQFTVIYTNEYHHLFYSKFNFNGDEFGKLFYVHVGIMYSCILAGIFMIARKFRKEFYHTKQFLEISLAIIIPLLANIYYLSGYYHKLMKNLNLRAFDITPIAFSLSLGVFVYAIYKRDFLNIMPVLEDEIMKHISAGVVVLDSNEQVIELNETANNYQTTEPEIEIYWKGIEEVDKVIEYSSGKYIHIQKRILIGNRQKLLGYLITMMDVTSYIVVHKNIEEQVEELKTINYELKEKIKLNDTLSKISARNFVARELHDILGYSMTISIKLLEIAKIECESGGSSKEVESRLIKAHENCQKGYSDLRKSLKENQNISYDLVSLKTEINKMGKVIKVAGVEFSLEMSKINGLLIEEEYQTIRRFIQESITNSVKHGKATKIKVFMDFNQKGNQIIVQDNGIGCGVITKGNGLKGMEYRAESINGSISFKTKKGEGFIAKLEY